MVDGGAASKRRRRRRWEEEDPSTTASASAAAAAAAAAAAQEEDEDDDEMPEREPSAASASQRMPKKKNKKKKCVPVPASNADAGTVEKGATHKSGKESTDGEWQVSNSHEANCQTTQEGGAGGIPGDADAGVNVDLDNGKGPDCSEVKNDDLAANPDRRKKKRQKKCNSLSGSPSSLQKSEGIKEPRDTGSCHSKTTTQDCSLPTAADGAGLAKTVAENNAPGRKHKRSKQRRSHNAVNAGEGKGAHGGSVIVKKDVVPPGLPEGGEANKVTESSGSGMNDSKKVAADDVSDLNVKAHCLHSTRKENGCHNAVAGGLVDRLDSVSRTCTSEANQKSGPAERMGKASLPPSPIRGVIEDGILVVPMKPQHGVLDLSEEGASFSFQIGDRAPGDGPDARYDVKMDGSSIVGNSGHRLSSSSSFGCTNTEINEAPGKVVACSSRDQELNYVNPSSLAQAHKENLKSVFSPTGSLIRFQRKKLLILDLNGLLADINQDYHNAHLADAKVRSKLVFKRPYCDDFLRFCFQTFELGIWSSRMKQNVDSVVSVLMRDLKPYLLFCWDISKCTVTGQNTLENIHKPLVLKELKKLWNKEVPDLPWELGDFSPSNTLLVDDSPYKALRNPPHTAIFPYPYSYINQRDDSLGPRGDLRVYLERLAVADDVQCYVREHPFGQPCITHSDPHWNFYAQIADKVDNSA